MSALGMRRRQQQATITNMHKIPETFFRFCFRDPSCLSGSNATPLDKLCRATAVALHWCRISRLMFSQCRTRIALHLKVSQTRPCRTPLGGVSHLKLAMHTYIIKSCRATGGVAATVLRVVLHCDTKDPTERKSWWEFRPRKSNLAAIRHPHGTVHPAPPTSLEYPPSFSFSIKTKKPSPPPLARTPPPFPAPNRK